MLTPDDVLTVHIPQRVWDLATEWEEVVLSNVRGENYTRLTEPHRYQIGYVGELLFQMVLAERRKKYSYRVHLDGKSHPAEFAVYHYHDGLPRSVDVKTARRPQQSEMMIPAFQFNRHRYGVYVGIRLRGDGQSADVMGWATRKDLEQRPPEMLKCWTVLKNYYFLRPIEQFFKLILDEQPTTTEENNGEK